MAIRTPAIRRDRRRYQSPDQLGLITLSGIVVAPYPFRDWRVKPNAAGERRR